MQDIESHESFGDATVVQSCLKKSRKGDVYEKMELCTKAGSVANRVIWSNLGNRSSMKTIGYIVYLFRKIEFATEPKL